MRRRHVSRKVQRVVGGVAVLLLLTVVLTPERSRPTAAPDPRGPLASIAGPAPSASLPLQPLWRPAGTIFNRKATSAALPFGIGTRKVGALESLDRWHQIYTFSVRYHVKPELTRRIYDAALVAGIEPDLAFRLVRAESEFNPRAISKVGAIGLTQVMPATAREFEPQITREALLDPDTNLRVGLSYLRVLIRENKGDLRMALLTYNRGPVAVQQALSAGTNPANGYDSQIMRGYRGRGVLD
jgi:soluble lytic murein transglycosylase-like protein